MSLRVFRGHGSLVCLLNFSADFTDIGQAPGMGAISGVVNDTSGRVIGNAEVESLNEITHASRSALTSAEGVFRVPLLLPGTYTVTVRAAGFATRASTHVEVTVSETASLNLTLSVASSSATVEVDSDAEILQQESSTLGRAMDQEAIKALPPGHNGVGFVRGHGQRNVDMAVERILPATESSSFRFRTEFFNLTNPPQFGNPNNDVEFTLGPSGPVNLNPAFGRSLRTSPTRASSNSRPSFSSRLHRGARKGM
jgi:hypothetical protein